MGGSGGGGGPGGLPPPFLCHDVGFWTLGPKLDPRLPPPFACRPNLDPPPPFTNPGSAPDTTPVRSALWSVNIDLRCVCQIGVKPRDAAHACPVLTTMFTMFSSVGTLSLVTKRSSCGLYLMWRLENNSAASGCPKSLSDQNNIILINI